MNQLRSILALLLLSSLALTPLPSSAIPAEDEPPPDPHLNDPKPTTVVVRVVAHGSMVLGKEVGGARVTITDVESGLVLASGLQQGDAGDQNQIMRTPHLMEEPLYSSRASAAFTATLELTHPRLVDIAAEGPLAYPAAAQRVNKRLWLIPGHDLTNDGIVLTLYGYIVQIEQPKPGGPLIAKEDVKLRASVRTLSGAWVRPHGDWDSRKMHIYGELLIGDRIVERLQMFYSGERAAFEAPFFVPLPHDAPDGVTLRVVAADSGSGNFGVGEARYPVVTEPLPPSRRRTS